ncbi:hypothetical protein MRX96_019176 [Rhipicephalus microplus]
MSAVNLFSILTQVLRLAGGSALRHSLEAEWSLAAATHWINSDQGRHETGARARAAGVERPHAGRIAGRRVIELAVTPLSAGPDGSAARLVR